MEKPALDIIIGLRHQLKLAIRIGQSIPVKIQLSCLPQLLRIDIYDISIDPLILRIYLQRLFIVINGLSPISQILIAVGHILIDHLIVAVFPGADLVFLQRLLKSPQVAECIGPDPVIELVRMALQRFFYVFQGFSLIIHPPEAAGCLIIQFRHIFIRDLFCMLAEFLLQPPAFLIGRAELLLLPCALSQNRKL